MIVGGNWKTLIPWELRDRHGRFGELRRRMDGISEKVLTQQLRDLEGDGVPRRQVNEVPPCVEYSLTAFGQSLDAALEPLCVWGERHLDGIEEGRRSPAIRDDDGAGTMVASARPLAITEDGR